MKSQVQVPTDYELIWKTGKETEPMLNMIKFLIQKRIS